MLEQVYRIPIGTKMVEIRLPGSFDDIARRLREGDATLGWRGDPTMELVPVIETDSKNNPVRGGWCGFEVWAADLRGQRYMALRWRQADPSLIRRLVEIDPYRVDLEARYAKEKTDAETAITYAAEERAGEVWDKLEWALDRDDGYMETGLSRNQFAVGAPTQTEPAVPAEV